MNELMLFNIDSAIDKFNPKEFAQNGIYPNIWMKDNKEVLQEELKEHLCPECGAIIDIIIKGMCLNWRCRNCDYDIVTTVNKLCFWDNGSFREECYTKSEECPYFDLI